MLTKTLQRVKQHAMEAGLTERATLSRKVLELDGESDTLAVLTRGCGDGTHDIALNIRIREERLLGKNSLVDGTLGVVCGWRSLSKRTTNDGGNAEY